MHTDTGFDAMLLPPYVQLSAMRQKKRDRKNEMYGHESVEE
jgi:hypothetical protein